MKRLLKKQIDNEDNKISHKEFLDMCMREEEDYKKEYSEEELKEVIKGYGKCVTNEKQN